jgi:RNA polymerase sigma-B factor
MERPSAERHEGDEGSRTAALLRAYHLKGDITARDRLVEVYLPLVQSFARRYSRSSDDYDDLYQVGCIGLIQAIDRFRPDRGDELAAYAVPNIAGEIRRYLRDRGGSVRLPRRVLELRGAAAHTQRELAAQLGRAPTPAEVARELDAEEQDVALALDADRASQAFELDDAREGDTQAMDAAENRLFLSGAVRGLEEIERQILYMRYVEDLEPAAIASQTGLSARQLSRKTKDALGKLRTELERSPQRPAQEPARDLPPPKPEPNIAAMGTNPAHPGPGTALATQPYHIELVRETGPQGGWRAQVEELPGCVAKGGNAEEAIERIEMAIRDWIADAVAHKRDVPKPRSPSSHSGRLLVRMPQSLHADLARAAELEEVSLNQFITSSLASVIGWRQAGGRPSPDESSGKNAGKDAWTALRVNLIVLSVVGVIALILLAIAVAQRL